MPDPVRVILGCLGFVLGDPCQCIFASPTSCLCFSVQKSEGEVRHPKNMTSPLTIAKPFD